MFMGVIDQLRTGRHHLVPIYGNIREVYNYPIRIVQQIVSVYFFLTHT